MRRGTVPPHPVEQLVDRDRAVRIHQKGGEDALLPCMTQDRNASLHPGFELAENPELDAWHAHLRH
jgi:hypothetical protein